MGTKDVVAEMGTKDVVAEQLHEWVSAGLGL